MADVRCVKCESRWRAPLVDGRSPPCATCGATATYALAAASEVGVDAMAVAKRPYLDDRDEVAAMLAQGHDLRVEVDSRGDVSVRVHWDSEHSGVECARCGYWRERGDIPPCDGALGKAHRLRAAEREALREWERAERAARQAEREAGTGDPLGYETRAPIEAVARLMAEDATAGRDREAVDAERARAGRHLSGGWATEDGKSMHRLEGIADCFARAALAPVVLVNRGQPSAVLMSVDEFRRLKQAAGEPVPSEAMPRTSSVIRRTD